MKKIKFHSKRSRKMKENLNFWDDYDFVRETYKNPKEYRHCLGIQHEDGSYSKKEI